MLLPAVAWAEPEPNSAVPEVAEGEASGEADHAGETGESNEAGEAIETVDTVDTKAEIEEEPEPEQSIFVAGNQSPERASDFGPAGISLDHSLRRQDWTFAYHYQRVSYDGLRDGQQKLTTADASAPPYGYSVIPVSQVNEQHTFSVMYAPRNRLNFMLTLPFVQKVLEVDDEGMRQTHRSSGIGDAKLMFLVPFIRKGDEKTHLNFGMSFPTGSIEQTDSMGQRLPYAMQLGSGTWDALWGLTYTGRHRAFAWGGQFDGLYRLATNSIGYRLGTVYKASAWASASWTEYASASVRLGWTRTGNAHNVDPELDKSVNPMNDNMRQSGTVLDIGPGVNLMLPFFGRQLLAFEVTWPIFEDLDGPQLAKEITFSAGWQWVF